MNQVTAEPIPPNLLICRVCEAPDNLQPLFSSDTESDLAAKMVCCASVQISQNDGLPQHLCSTCRNDLEAAYAFRVRCECADSNFRKILSLKSEPFIEDDDFKEDKTVTFEEDIDSDAPISELLPKSDTDLLDDARSLYEEQEGSDTGEKDYEVFTCETCGKVLSTFQQYRAHVKAKHEQPRKSTEAPKKFCCEKCSLEFKCQSAYQRHISAVHEKRRDYLCKICGEAFAEKYGLRSHQTVHADERYPCSKCPSTFKWKRSLIHHEQLHLPPEERDPKLVKKYKPSKKKYICSFCGKISNNISCHVVHERWHTDERPYNCVTCSKKFRTSTQLRKHELTHTNTRSYECQECHKCFRQKSHLVTHTLVHTQEKNHVCNICSKAFSLKASLRAHMKSHDIFVANK